MCSGTTNCSPQDVLNGKWILVNFPPSHWGQTGLLISVGWKHLMELAILERKAEDNSPFCVIWADEAHAFTTAHDGVSFIPQCRSHKGCLVYLTQSVSSFYASMKGENGRHQADSLMNQFSHWIVHACDPITAKAAAAKLGRKIKTFYGGNTSPAADATAWDMLYGDHHSSASFSTHMEPALEEREFMVGRTGGPANRFLADAILLRSGEPFVGGNNFLKVVFSQKG
jgi:hypothetical protein